MSARPLRCGAALVLALGACSGPTKTPPAAVPTLNPTPSRGSALTPPPGPAPPPQAHQSVPNPSALQRPRRAIVVGGCAGACAQPKAALQAFFAASLDGDAPALQTLVEASLLVDRGQAYGERWAGWWLDGHELERSVDIARWCAAWLEEIGRPLDPADRARGVASFRVIGETQRLWTVEWRAPPRGADGAARVWRLWLTRRGLEWLVSRIELAPEAP